jgi:2-methylisocitrate lyase-like PEP mutase family enzyme
MPDAGFLTLTENVRHICAATTLPVLVDCDAEFGSALNVIRTVEDVIRAGAAGLFLEDQVAPKRCGYTQGKEVISIEEACGKYRAEIDVRDRLDPDFIIMARTDSRGADGGSMEEVLSGGKAAAAGEIVDEDGLMAAEKNAMRELSQSQATVDRMKHMLRTGKPLRN